MRRIIDCHVHHLHDSDVEWAKSLGYRKICLMDTRPEVLAEALRKFPDFVIALGWLPMDRDTAAGLEMVGRFRDIGCRGFKACCAGARYDDERFYPLYEKAQQYHMPFFFHTGWLDQRLVAQIYPTQVRLMADWYHPITLDRIALDFPDLKLVAFHMGGSYIADAAILMLNHANVYADSCRGFGSPSHFWGQIGGDAGGYTVLSKMVFGTDGMGTRQTHQTRIEHLSALLDKLGAPPGLQDRIFYRNALRVLGMDEELRKTFRIRRPKPAAGAFDVDQAAAGPLDASMIDDFIDRVGNVASSKTQCWMSYDVDALHLAVRCEDNHCQGLVITRDGPVEEIWQDDCVEFFLSPTADADYYHIVINPAGRMFMHHGRYGDAIPLPEWHEDKR